MTSEDFIDFKSMAGKVKNLAVDDDGEKIPWSKVRHVRACAQDPEALEIKTIYEGSTQRLNLNRRKRASGDIPDGRHMKLIVGQAKPGISETKKKDLISLCDSGQIPAMYKPFYTSLPLACAEDQPDDEED
ncbi:DNA repair protein rhp54 [Elysia marginata]|uniref:DNA repair protein rhp54 n=1 Tax=Elysia marginata TaxID=1093978 RepID=A0AAV4GD49_9GAST|nr:DNA repair protein rhp54 [Elysia marginata]